MRASHRGGTDAGWSRVPGSAEAGSQRAGEGRRRGSGSGCRGAGQSRGPAGAGEAARPVLEHLCSRGAGAVPCGVLSARSPQRFPGGALG